jgi:hypothetical protein
MRVALLGFPQAGKHTLFALLTGRSASHGAKGSEAPEGHAPVRDPRVDRIAEIAGGRRVHYAETTFVLCPAVGGESRREGWLEPARRCELLCMVVRAFTDQNVYHPAGSVDAARDRSSLETELLLADLEMVEKRLDRIEKEKRGGQSPLQAMEEHTLARCREAIEKDRRPSELNFERQELESVRGLGLLTLKPALWTYNVDEKDVRDEGEDPLRIACKIEGEIMAIEDRAERKEFLASLGLSASGVDRMNRAAYHALGLISFFTMNEEEVRAWSVRKGDTAPAAAGRVHTDMERGFIRVEVMKYEDLVSAGSEAALRERGRALLKGHDYIIEDGDICKFRFSV